MSATLAGRIWRAIYTSAVRGRFAAFGGGSHIQPPARLVSPHLVRIGSGVTISEHAWLNAKDASGRGAPTLTIGDRTYIGRFAQINAWESVVVESDVLIADRVFISDADHNYEDLETPIIHQGDSFRGKVVIRSGAWLGIGVVVMPGVTVGRHAIVAANAVVTADVPDLTVVGGIPARVIKTLQPQP